jgi:hypothetical protein
MLIKYLEFVNLNQSNFDCRRVSINLL